MDRLPYRVPRRWWRPNLRRPFMRVLRLPRIWFRQKRRERVLDVEVRGLEHLRSAMDRGCGVLIASQHVGHADAFVMLRAGDKLGVPFYYLVGWQVFELLGPLSRWVLWRHGAISIDRESFDMKAFRAVVTLLRTSRHPLVLFPEGEVYHQGERVFPFRTGVAAIALTAAREGARPIVIVPAAIRYEYVEDIRPKLNEVLTAMEKHILWQPRPDSPLPERLKRLAYGVLAIRELDFLGAVQTGSYPARLEALMVTILDRLEKRYGVRARDNDPPSRVTHLRHFFIQNMAASPAQDAQSRTYQQEMDELEVVVQLYSYQHDFDADNTTIERQAEMVDKYEEDVLGAPTATVRGWRRATIVFGEPVAVVKPASRKADPQPLTAELERAVQKLADELHGKISAPCAARVS